jgi:dienelactone hydrolase
MQSNQWSAKTARATTLAIILAVGCSGSDTSGFSSPPLQASTALAGMPAPAPVVPNGTGGTPAGGAIAGSGVAGTPATTTAGVPATATAGRGGATATGGAGSTALAGAAAAGTGGTSASAGAGGTTAGTGATGTGTCCPTGDCLCHGPDPTALTSSNGPYKTANARISTGTLYYPTDAEPPLAAVVICPGFLNTGPEMAPWGPLYASHGIVMVAVSTGSSDQPDQRATKLLAAITELKKLNTDSSSPISGKLSGRYGTSGYSMGGGGTTIASGKDATLKTSVGLAAWGGSGSGVKVPTLLFCGSSDTTAPCNMSQGVYTAIAEPTPKMMIQVPGATHFSWFGPTDAGSGMSGKYALAFQKVYLEGDERWKPLLLMKPASGTVTTNIK